jgi:hypothetical protein
MHLKVAPEKLRAFPAAQEAKKRGLTPNGVSKLRVLCGVNCPKGLENSVQGSNPEGKAGRLTYDRRRTEVFDYPFFPSMSRLSAVTKASRLTPSGTVFVVVCREWP